jgi:hypothetical protein
VTLFCCNIFVMTSWSILPGVMKSRLLLAFTPFACNISAMVVSTLSLTPSFGVRQKIAIDFPSTDFTSGSIHDPTRVVEEQPEIMNRMVMKKKIFVFMGLIVFGLGLQIYIKYYTKSSLPKLEKGH